ncbi:hypothetical protein BJ742DRAFT_787736 [Cladochytrium replicatum]|nr:hypothetical protein BJ742DRAFT_787736 [Cladochytrium replicatum]
MLAPSREVRNKCWQARDMYYACLDINHLWLDGLEQPKSKEECLDIDPSQYDRLPAIQNNAEKRVGKAEAKKLRACAELRKQFEAQCLPSWTQHFSMLRVKDLQVDYLKRSIEEEDRKRQQGDSDFWEKVKQPK